MFLDLWSRMSERDKSLARGEKQVRQIQEELTRERADQSAVARPVANLPKRDDNAVKDVWRLESELTRQQVQLDKMQRDTVEDAKAVTDNLNQVHAMVSEVNFQAECR